MPRAPNANLFTRIPTNKYASIPDIKRIIKTANPPKPGTIIS